VEKNGQIEIRVSGKIGNVDINPDNFDIREIISILENVDDLLYNGDKKNRPLISYDIQEGSVRNIQKNPRDGESAKRMGQKFDNSARRRARA
jgi:hypothetical protein